MNRNNRTLLRVLLVSTTLALSTVAFTVLPAINFAEAKNGSGNGGGKGGQGHSHGNHGAGSGGQGGASHTSMADQKHATPGAAADDSDETNDELAASDLGKLNGFFHASPQALKNASPVSAPGSISQSLRDLLQDYVAQGEDTEEADGEDDVNIDDLAEVLADASNKPMSPGIVDAILDKLSETYGDDYSSLSESEDTTEGDTTDDQMSDDSFAKELSDRVNEINGFSSSDEEDGQEPS